MKICENIHSQISQWDIIPSIQLDSWTQYRCSMWAMVWVRTTQEGVVGRDSTRGSTRVESTTVLRSVPPWMEHGRGSLDTNAHDPRFHPAIQISIPRRNRHPVPNDYLMFDNFWMDLCIFQKRFWMDFCIKKSFEWICTFLKKGFEWINTFVDYCWSKTKKKHMNDMNEQRKDVSFDKCKQYWLNGGRSLFAYKDFIWIWTMESPDCFHSYWTQIYSKISSNGCWDQYLAKI